VGWIVGVDTGGTFTDVFGLSSEGEARVAKVPSTPPHFDVAVVEGVAALGIEPGEVETLFHGTGASPRSGAGKVACRRSARDSSTTWAGRTSSRSA
jgi:hypothetical protein